MQALAVLIVIYEVDRCHLFFLKCMFYKVCYMTYTAKSYLIQKNFEILKNWLTEGYLIKNKSIIKALWYTHYLNHLKINMINFLYYRNCPFMFEVLWCITVSLSLFSRYSSVSYSGFLFETLTI